MKSFVILFIFLYSVALFAQDPFDTAVDLTTSTDPSQGVAFADYNNDGWVDLVVTRGFADFGNNIYNSYLNLFFENTGSQTNNPFNNIAVTGLTTQDSISGAATWGDVNNDGYLDLIICNTGDGWSFGTGAALWQNDFFLEK